MVVLQVDPLDAGALEAEVRHPGAGAILTFQGVTRDHFEGRAVTGLSYEAYPEMALSVMAQIRDEAAARWPGVRLAMAHRLGALVVGEVSVIIVASAPHREACYASSRYAIDELKARVPIWKREHYADGAADWKPNAP